MTYQSRWHVEVRWSVWLLLSVALMISFLFSACNTGIEGTRTIKMSRAESKITQPTEEDRFAEQFDSQKLADWSLGKRFLLSDSKAALIYQFPPEMSADSIVGHTLSYEGLELRPTPGGMNVVTLIFNDNNNKVYFPTNRSSVEELKDFTGLDLPMVIDLDLVDAAQSVLAGKTLWVRTGLWYDKNGEIVDGLRLVPVTIARVRPGNSLFPLIVDFKTGQAQEASLLMNISSHSGIGAESRTFASLFSLTDPRKNYPSVTDHIWDLITRGKVEIGMTKEECKLALGSPSDIQAGHTWGNIVDYWGYKDGTFLYFEDGRLVNFRN